MGRIKSERQMKKDGNKIDNDELLMTNFSPISLLLFIFGIVGEAYITIKYIGKDPYANYSLILLILGVISFSGVLYLNKGQIRLQEKYIKQPVIWTSYIVFLMFILAVTWFVARTQLKYALSDTDLYFYYISTAIMEEMFFRMFLCSLLKIKFDTPVLIIIPFTAFLFMLIHIEFYGDQPVFLGVMFIGGLFFSIFYIYTKDITITMIAHILLNIYAVGNLLIST